MDNAVKHMNEAWRKAITREARELVGRRGRATTTMKFNKAAKSAKRNPPKNMRPKEQQEKQKTEPDSDLSPELLLGAGDRKIAKPYEPTSDELAALEAVRARRKETPRVTASSDENAHKLVLDHPEPYYGCCLLMKALGTLDPDFYQGFLPQLARAATQGQSLDEVSLNFMIAVIKGVEPRDQLECLLAAQMGAIHMLTMDFACRLTNADNIPLRDSAERTLNKLARTFSVQLETLKRYRSNGEQKVTVEHVTVNEGGKAIVGTVTHGGAGGSEKRETTP
jgi:hypothetical protein